MLERTHLAVSITTIQEEDMMHRFRQLVGVGLIVLALVSGGLWFYQQNAVPMAPVPSTTITDDPTIVEPTETPSATPTPSTTRTSPTSTPKPTPVAMRDPKGKPTQIVVRRGKDVLISAKLTAGGEDAQGVWQAAPGTSSWLSDAGRPAPGVRHASLRSVVTAHVRYGGKPDVFWRLREVRKGDLVYVTYTSKDSAVFRIAEQPRGFSKSQMVKQDAYWDVTRPSRELTLITCDQSSVVRPDGHLTDNLAVRATRIK